MTQPPQWQNPGAPAQGPTPPQQPTHAQAGHPHPYGQPQPAYQPTAHPPYAAPPQGPPSGLSITAFVLGLIGCLPVFALAAIIVGIIALVKKQAMRGLAIAGIALGSLWIALTVVFFASGAAAQFSEGFVSAFEDEFYGDEFYGDEFYGDEFYDEMPLPAIAASDIGLSLGDCFDDPDAYDWEHAGTRVEVVDCADPHEFEVYLVGDLEGTVWPGQLEVYDEADRLCYDAFEEFIDYAYYRSELYYISFEPTEESWAAGDRMMLCAITAERKTTGTLEGSRR